MTTTKKKADAPTTELLAQKYTLAMAGRQSARYDNTTKAVGEYVGREYSHEMKVLVLQGTETTPMEPTLPDGATRQQELVWGKKYDLYLKRLDRYDEQKAKVFTIILSQCEDAMKHHVECHGIFQKAESMRDVVTLLERIKELAYGSNDKKYPP